MAILVADCPHCLTSNSGMVIFGTRPWPKEFMRKVANNKYRTDHFRWDVSIGAQCQNCHEPISARLSGGGEPVNVNGHTTFAQSVNQQLLAAGNVIDMGFVVAALWPQAPAPTIPAHTPPIVGRAMLQAEKNYPIVGNEEAAAMMYRRALELTLGDLHSELKGTLAARIKTLVDQKVLPDAIGDWADEIRELGNEAAHDPDEVSRDQLRMIRGFADAILRYLYTLPAEVAARRKLPDENVDTKPDAPAAG